jgi:hypothetical protein
MLIPTGPSGAETAVPAAVLCCPLFATHRRAGLTSKLANRTSGGRVGGIAVRHISESLLHNKRNEIVVVESNKKEPALSVARVAGFNFVFDRKLRADPSPDHKAARAEKVLLTVIVPNEIVNRAPFLASPKP